MKDTLLVEDAHGNQTTIPADTPQELLDDRGWTTIEGTDVKRKRSRRTAKQMRELIASGAVREPGAPKPARQRSDNEHVVDVPTATASGKVS